MSNALKRYGGKWYLAGRIIDLMPPHLHYVETYFGGGAVLFARDQSRDWFRGSKWFKEKAEHRGCSEVINDIDAELMNFWAVLQDPDLFKKFKRKVSCVPMSQALFENCRDRKSWGRIDRAIGTFVRFRQSRLGMAKSFATLSRNRTRGKINEQANSWLGAIEGLPEAHERLMSVVILCDTATRVIRSQDGKRTHFYCDPPYYPDSRFSTGQFEAEMSHGDHEVLLNTLSEIKGTFQLSGYKNDLYDMYSKQQGWRRVDVKIDNKASSAKTKERKIESIWMNY